MPQKLLCISRQTNDKRRRTADVLIRENVDFAGLMLRTDVLTGLKRAGFQRPSPIQLKAIPLGRCGLDLIVQAKSGTGKTCVFAVVALESVCVDSGAVQVLVLAPTREIAVQLWEVINMLGSAMTALRCYTFIGGLPLADDVQKLQCCHIVVGTPGRVKQLIEENILDTSTIRLFVLDEADKLLEENFQESVNWIYSTLPENKQMMAVSATYPETLALHLRRYMRNPTFVRLNITDPALLGIRQYYEAAAYNPQKAYDNKVKQLTRLLSSVNFHQCLVFSNYQMRAQSLSDTLNAHGWPATYISGSREQQDRLAAMAQLKTLQCRVLISTDLTARGIDADHVNLVVNLDLPHDHETYLHRIGRAGRFGTYGAAVSFVNVGQELDGLRDIAEKCDTKILQLPDPIPVDLAKSSGFVYNDDLVTTEQIFTVEPHTRETQRRQDVTTNGNRIGGSSSACANSTHSSVGMLDKLGDIVMFGRRPSHSKGSISYGEAAADFKHFMAASDGEKMLDSVQCDLTQDSKGSAAHVSFLELVENVTSLLGTLTHCEDNQVTTVTSCPARPVDSGIVISDTDGDIGEVGMSADRPTCHKVGSVFSDAGETTVGHVYPADKDNTHYNINGDSCTISSGVLRQSKSDGFSVSDDDDLLNAGVECCIGCKKQFFVLPGGLSPLPCQPEIGFYLCYECADRTPVISQSCVMDDGLGAECVRRLRARDVHVEDPLSDPDSDLLYQSVSSSPMSEQSATECKVSCDIQPCLHRTSDTCCTQYVTSGHIPLDPTQDPRMQVPVVHNSWPGHHHRHGEDMTTTQIPFYYQEEASHFNQSDRHRPSSGSGHKFQPTWSTLSNYGNESETYSEQSNGQSAGEIYRGCCDKERVATQQLYARMCYDNYVYHLQCAQSYKNAYTQIEHGQRMMGIYTAQKHYIQHMGKFAARCNKNGQS